jgi:hypothetical protein
MSLGGGALAGGLVGGLAAFGLGVGYQKYQGKDGVSRIHWSKDFLIEEWKASGMRYLMVAHFGRGQGSWQDPLPSSWPVRWRQLIDDWTTAREPEISAALTSSNTDRIQMCMEDMIKHTLNTLYPGANS